MTCTFLVSTCSKSIHRIVIQRECSIHKDVRDCSDSSIKCYLCLLHIARNLTLTTIISHDAFIIISCITNK